MKPITKDYFKVPKNLLNEMANYLTSRPYKEVASMMNSLTTIQYIKEDIIVEPDRMAHKPVKVTPIPDNASGKLGKVIKVIEKPATVTDNPPTTDKKS